MSSLTHRLAHLAQCEQAARTEGFRRLELVAALASEPIPSLNRLLSQL